MFYSHHARRTGYVQLAHHLQSILDAQPLGRGRLARFVATWPTRTQVSLVQRSLVKPYNVESLLTEADVIEKWFGVTKSVFHFLNGDELYRFTGNLKRVGLVGKRNTLIATYHLPPAIFKEMIVARNHLKRLDHVLAVGSSQVPFLQEIVGESKVTLIPHGVDTQYFAPLGPKPPKEPLTCLCVGHFLRDMDTLLAVSWILKLTRTPVRITLVNPFLDMPHFAKLDNVQIKRGISDDELLRLYQTADIFVMPLRDCTANNALLEAMACGMPCVVTSVGSTCDYVDSGSAILVPPADPEAMANAIIRLVDDRDLRITLGEQAREQALRFEWRGIARRVADAYVRIKDS